MPKRAASPSERVWRAAAGGNGGLRFRVGDRVRVGAHFHATITDVSDSCEVVDEGGRLHWVDMSCLTPAPLRPGWAGERAIVQTDGLVVVGNIINASVFGAFIVEERTGLKFGPFLWSNINKL